MGDTNRTLNSSFFAGVRSFNLDENCGQWLILGWAMIPNYRPNIATFESCKALLAVILYQLSQVSLFLLHGLELDQTLLVTFLRAWHAN